MEVSSITLFSSPFPNTFRRKILTVGVDFSSSQRKKGKGNLLFFGCCLFHGFLSYALFRQLFIVTSFRQRRSFYLGNFT